MDVQYIGTANKNTRELPIERRENYIRKSAFDIIATPCFSRRTKSGVLPQFLRGSHVSDATKGRK